MRCRKARPVAATDLFANVPRNIEPPPPGKPAYFWWLLANALALCFAVFSWMFCLHVFGNPEIPWNYEILRKLKRLPELKRYTVLDVPNGNALSPKELYQKFFGASDEQVARVNSLLMRNYLTNFDRPLLLTYVEGKYQIEEKRALNGTDFFSPGVVVRAQALVKPDEFTNPAPYPVLIEYVFPTKDPAAPGRFNPGDILDVKKSPNCAAIVHVDKVVKDDEPALLLTVIPIAYGPYQVGKSGSFSIEPPDSLHPAAKFPVFKQQAAQ
jgi:hypothetical protein